jgi:hypothetical protein
VLAPEDARILFESLWTDTLVGLRDRALLGVLIYSFARASAKVKKTRVFETVHILNSRVNPNTCAPKMVPGRYDPVYEGGLFFVREMLVFQKRRSGLSVAVRQMERKSEHGAYLKLLADRRITLRNLNSKATYSTVRIRS